MNTPQFLTSPTFIILFLVCILIFATIGVGSNTGHSSRISRNSHKMPVDPQQQSSRQFNVGFSVNYASSTSSQPSASIYRDQAAHAIPSHDLATPCVQHTPVDREVLAMNQRLVQLEHRG